MTHAAKVQYEPSAGGTAVSVLPLRPAVVPPAFFPAEHRDPLPWNAAAWWSVAALLLADFASLFAARELALWLRNVISGPMPMSPAFVAASVLWLAMRALGGLYPAFGLSQPEELKRSTLTTVLAGLCHLSLLFAIQQTSGSRFIALGVWMLLIPLGWILRDATKRLLVRWRAYGQPVIVLGAGKTGHLAIREFLDNPTLGIVPVAVFDDDPSKHGWDVEGVPVVGTLDDAVTWEPPYSVRNAIIAISSVNSPRVLTLAHELGQRYRNVGVVADVIGVGNLWTNTKVVGTCSVVEMRHERFDRVNLIIKRVFDLVVGIPLFLLSIPVIAVCAIAVWISSPAASPFYTQSRMGLNGRRMRMWKIRTMIPNADRALKELLRENNGAREHWQRHMKLEHDPRVIRRLGRVLRKSSLDELPQLWNVVKGEMSLVGPRPFPDYHLSHFTSEFRELRTAVPPGITGYWQVTHRSASNIDQQRAADTYYIYNWSFWLDLWIMFRTVGVVLSGKGAY
jgi:Undecaprenyl-phosphate galactose phosphotransferase WbaP